MRNTVSDLIIIRSDRVTFHPLLIAPRDHISPVLANNLEFVCVDAKQHRCLVVCKHCHTVFYNETWNRPNISKHLSRFHGIEQTDGKLKSTVRKRLQATKILANENASTPPTPMEAAPIPSVVVKISNLRKPSQEVTLPQDSEARKLSQEVTVPEDTEANALTKLEIVPDKKPAAKKRSQRHKPAETTLDADQLPLADKKQIAKKRRKPSADDVSLKKKKQQVPSSKQQKPSVFEDKTNF